MIWFTKGDIPTYKYHKRPVQPIVTPFLRCEKQKNPDKGILPNSSSASEDVNADESVQEEDKTVDKEVEEVESVQEESGGDETMLMGVDDEAQEEMESTEKEMREREDEHSEGEPIEIVTSELNNVNVQNEHESFSLNTEAIGNVEQMVITDQGSTSCVNVKEEVVSALKEVLTGKILTDEMNEFVENLTDKINSKLETSQTSKIELKGEWMTTATHLICQPCLRYGKSANVPTKLKQHEQFGFIVKSNDSRDKFVCSRHEQSELHTWCLEEQKRIESLNKETEMKSRQAGMLIVRNALLCLKRGLSAKDFMSLNNKDNLTEGITTATKNDSKTQFFDIRNVAFEKLTNITKDIFANIEWFTLTLDKVTVGRLSYTVIMTYFFVDGRIYVLLNKLVHLSTKDYDGPGTAEMVLKCLEETTGLTRTEIKEKLVHVSYDGVYAEREERIRGGGSLSLRSNLETKLNLEKGSITGTWDPAHRMQITFGEMMSEHPEVLKFLKLLFEAMKIYHVGKSATLFAERADELGNSVVTNKIYQSTRFVFALVRGANGGLRNLPTIVTLIEDDLKAALIGKDNTEAKRLEKLKAPLTDGYNLAMIIGIIQIMEKFTCSSLVSQNSFFFPSMVWKSINTNKAAIATLAKKWVWEEKNLPISGIGSPKKHIENLKKGKYCAFVPKGAKKVPKPTESDTATSQSLPLGQTQAEPITDQDEECLAGDFPVETSWCAKEDDLIANLQEICETLCELWDERQTETDQEKLACELFGSPHNICALPYEEQFQFILNKTSDFISVLPDIQAANFDAVFIVPGFLEWNRFFDTHKSEPINKLYQKWYLSLRKEQRVQYKPFTDIFECFNVRVMSEAICETVGSMMKSHLAGGRNLQPQNFSKELFLRFNLGPLHLLDPLCNDIINSKPKMFFRKLDKSRMDKLVSVHSSAIATFRKEQEEKSTLPLSVFRDK